jgi:hypothetical protein
LVEEKSAAAPENVVEKPAEDSQETVVEELPQAGEEEASEGQA